MDELLDILQENSRYTDEQLAVMTGKSVEEVKKAISEYEKKGIIAGYKTMINWEEEGKDKVTAFIEVKITPQRIYKFEQVKSCYLMSSGGFDLIVLVEGNSMKEIASFVSEKLACQECVNGTATHFILKKYKDYGTIFKKEKVDDREAIFI